MNPIAPTADSAPSGPAGEDILDRALRWREQGRAVAVATVVSTWGSSPRPAGSQLVVRDDAAFVGSVSGGCVETAVVQEALAVIADGDPRLLEFGVSNESAWEVGLACGGTIRVLVERVAAAGGEATDAGLVEAIAAARAAKRPLVVATQLPGGHHTLIEPHGEPGAPVAAELATAAAAAARADRSAIVAGADGETFLQVFNPPLRLIIVGAVHIAQALYPMAQLAGFAVTVVDPRSAFASAERFPGVARVTEWPDEALAELAVDRRCAVVTLTHDPKLDEPALVAALASEAFYIGALGSRKTQAARLDRLREEGHDDSALARICGPIGLDIGARGAAEIAVAILAQIILTLRGPKGGATGSGGAARPVSGPPTEVA